MAIVYNYDVFQSVQNERRRRLNRFINKDASIIELCRTIECVIGSRYNPVHFTTIYFSLTRDQLDHLVEEVYSSSEEDWRKNPEYYLAASKVIRNRFPFLAPSR